MERAFVRRAAALHNPLKVPFPLDVLGDLLLGGKLLRAQLAPRCLLVRLLHCFVPARRDVT